MTENVTFLLQKVANCTHVESVGCNLSNCLVNIQLGQHQNRVFPSSKNVCIEEKPDRKPLHYGLFKSGSLVLCVA